MKGSLLKSLVAVVAVAALAASASAQQKIDTFGVVMEGNNDLVTGEGTGWDGGRWIYYDQTDWWNQWFYDDPPDPLRWKEIYYDIVVMPMPDPGAMVEPGMIQIALNWSTLDYPATGPVGPPPQPVDEPVIMREIIYSGPIGTGETVQLLPGIDDPFEIPYNPEWVSIDVWVDSWQEIEVETEPGVFDRIQAPMLVDIRGTIWHECVPEPATLSVLALGGLGVLLRRRRK